MEQAKVVTALLQNISMLSIQEAVLSEARPCAKPILKKMVDRYVAKTVEQIKSMFK